MTHTLPLRRYKLFYTKLSPSSAIRVSLGQGVLTVRPPPVLKSPNRFSMVFGKYKRFTKTPLYSSVCDKQKKRGNNSQSVHNQDMEK